MHSSRVGICDVAGIAVDRAGSASGVARNTDHVAANTGDTELHLNMGHSSRGRMPVPLRGRWRRQANPKA